MEDYILHTRWELSLDKGQATPWRWGHCSALVTWGGEGLTRRGARSLAGLGRC